MTLQLVKLDQESFDARYGKHAYKPKPDLSDYIDALEGTEIGSWYDVPLAPDENYKTIRSRLHLASREVGVSLSFKRAIKSEEGTTITFLVEPIDEAKVEARKERAKAAREARMAKNGMELTNRKRVRVAV